MSRSFSLTKCLAVLTPMVAVTLMYTWIRTSILQTGYQLSEQTRTHEILLDENKRLRMELSGLKSAERIQYLAKEMFNMNLPQDGQIIQLKQKPLLMISEWERTTRNKKDESYAQAQLSSTSEIEKWRWPSR